MGRSKERRRNRDNKVKFEDEELAEKQLKEISEEKPKEKSEEKSKDNKKEKKTKKDAATDADLDSGGSDINFSDSNSVRHNKKIQAGPPIDNDDNISIQAEPSLSSPREALYKDPKTIFVRKTADNHYVLDNHVSMVTRHPDNSYTINDDRGYRTIVLDNEGNQLRNKKYLPKSKVTTTTRRKNDDEQFMQQPYYYVPYNDYYSYPYGYAQTPYASSYMMPTQPYASVPYAYQQPIPPIGTPYNGGVTYVNNNNVPPKPVKQPSDLNKIQYIQTAPTVQQPQNIMIHNEQSYLQQQQFPHKQPQTVIYNAPHAEQRIQTMRPTQQVINAPNRQFVPVEDIGEIQQPMMMQQNKPITRIVSNSPKQYMVEEGQRPMLIQQNKPITRLINSPTKQYISVENGAEPILVQTPQGSNRNTNIPIVYYRDSIDKAKQIPSQIAVPKKQEKKEVFYEIDEETYNKKYLNKTKKQQRKPKKAYANSLDEILNNPNGSSFVIEEEVEGEEEDDYANNGTIVVQQPPASPIKQPRSPQKSTFIELKD